MRIILQGVKIIQIDQMKKMTGIMMIMNGRNLDNVNNKKCFFKL